MLYMVLIDRDSRGGSTLAPRLIHVGSDKLAAITSFKNCLSVGAGGGFSIIINPYRIYFAEFDSDTYPGSEWADKKQYTTADLNKILENLSLANALYAFTNYGPNKALKPSTCDDCGKSGTSLTRTAYGKNLCNDCFNYYLTDRSNTDSGSSIEFLVGIARGTYKLSAFTWGEVAQMITSWNAGVTKQNLAFTPTELIEIYEAAVAAGINDVVDMDGEPLPDLIDPRRFY